MHQGRLADALAAFEQARADFEALGEPATVAAAWQQIGMVREEAGHFDRAEAAYQRSLALKVELGDRAGQTATLNLLGSLYADAGRLEEAASLFRQAADLSRDLGDAHSEAGSLSNLATALCLLGRLDQARQAAGTAATRLTRLGYAAKPWRAWAVLHDIERDAGDAPAAARARQQALDLYHAYRQDGGEPMGAATRLVAAVGQALQADGPEAARDQIPGPERFGPAALPLRAALLAVVDGDRAPALADDPDLDPPLAVELSLLLASLPPDEA